MKSKVCTRCGKEKDVQDFSQTRKSNWCNLCTNQYKQEWRKRKPFNDILQAIKHRCRDPKYKVTENLLTINDVSFLWERDRAGKMGSPCLHRVDAEKGYTMSNCRFVEKAEHDAIHKIHLSKQQLRDNYLKTVRVEKL